VGRADRPARTALAVVSLLVGTAFGLATLYALLIRADDETRVTAAVSGPAFSGSAGAAWLEQRDRRQRGFAVDFRRARAEARFSTPIGGMPRTVPWRSSWCATWGSRTRARAKVLTVDFEASRAVPRGAWSQTSRGAARPAGACGAHTAGRGRAREAGVDAPAAPSGEPPPVVDTFG